MEMPCCFLHSDWCETTWFRLEQIVIVFGYLEQPNCRWQRTNQLEVQKWGPVSGGHLGAKVVMATLIFRDDNQGKGVLLS